jgi:N-formylglutamate amidohydrolase
VILHIPHAVSVMPITYPRLPRSYLDEFTDWGTDDLFHHEAADRFVFNYSRFFVDVERLPDDVLDIRGNGFYYTHTPDGIHCYRSKSDPEYAQALEIYEDWHRDLRKAASRNLSMTKNVAVIDCHSFSDRQAALIHGEKDFPDICIGDNGDTPLAALVAEGFADHGYTVVKNFPFSNAISPIADENLHCVMIEVNKRLDYTALANTITSILDRVAEFEFSGA